MELERVLKQAHAEISIHRAIRQIKKMYGINIQVTKDHAHIVNLKNNELQQTVLDIVNANF